MKRRIRTTLCSFALITSLIGATVFPLQASAESELSIVLTSPFSDVPVEHEAFDAIVWAKNRGIISGYVDGTFQPNATLTEAQLVKMLMLFLALKDDKGDLHKNTTASHWADSYYDSLAAYSTPLNGYFNNTIRNQPVKRGVVAQTISYLTGNTTSLSSSILFMLEHGITMGQNPQFEGQDLNQFFGTQNQLTRSQVALFLYRMHNMQLEAATGMALEAYANTGVATLAELGNRGIRILDDSIRIGPLGSNPPPPKNDTVVNITEAYIPVPKLMQKPELPNGCEIVSLTAVLNYYGYKVSKTTMADTYLPKQGFTYKGGQRYGPDPYKAYAGNPRSTGGWYSFAAPIVKAANNYMDTQKNKLKAINISGSSQKDILSYLNKGVPVVIWVTLDLTKPTQSGGWYFSDTGKYYKAYTNLHAVVLNGYRNGKVNVMNPLKGQVEYNLTAFFKSYEQLGKQAMILMK